MNVHTGVGEFFHFREVPEHRVEIAVHANILGRFSGAIQTDVEPDMLETLQVRADICSSGSEYGSVCQNLDSGVVGQLAQHIQTTGFINGIAAVKRDEPDWIGPDESDDFVDVVLLVARLR